ncbi:uncharacterized protein LOC143913416 [Arctopsyche grandis]|uniref:uncharacterized protein LOC143913416 n=1 Tax=Arctopsyche grandis TaxID=121162 RepID=UPI00406D9C71
MNFIKKLFLIQMIYLNIGSTLSSIRHQSLIPIDKNVLVCPYLYEKFEHEGNTVCVKKKYAEIKDDKYKDCNGNAVPLNFSHLISSNYIDLNILFWTDYRQAYIGGPIINWRYGDSNMGKPLLLDLVDPSTYYTDFESTTNLKCLAVDTKTQQFVPQHCNTKLQRLCITNPLKRLWLAQQGKCKNNFVYYDSPRPTCLSYVHTNKSIIFQNGTRREAETACKSISGQLLGKGYIYKHKSWASDDREVPTAIQSENGHFMYDNGEMVEEIITDIAPSNSKKFVSLTGSNKFILRDQNHIYNATVCEHPIEKPKMKLKIYSISSKLFVSIESDLYVSPWDIMCFTDSAEFYPTRVSVIIDINQNTPFRIETVADGYYWCISNVNNWEYNSSGSFFFVNKISDLFNTYNVQFTFPKPSHAYSEFDVKDYYLRELRRSNFSKSYGMEFVSSTYVLKKVYLNGGALYRTYISEYNLNKHENTFLNIPELMKLDSLFCSSDYKNVVAADGSINILENNNFIVCINEPNCYCRNYTCLQNGKIKQPRWSPKNYGCGVTTAIYDDSHEDSNESTEKYNNQPEEEMAILIKNMDSILNTTGTENTIHQVVHDLNHIVSFSRNVKIPSEVINKFDSILRRVELNSTNNGQIHSASSNLVVGVAETGGSDAIVGIMLKKITSDMTNTSINFLNSDKINLARGDTTDTEIIVEMPSFDTNSSGSLAVVVMNNDIFLQKNQNQTDWRVNSRVISISTNNMISFNNEKYIDIHLRPFVGELAPNEKRVCAFWDFTLGQEGGWSSAGCELLMTGSLQGMDTCRCYHLTHFAEIIQPGGSIISSNHQIALSVITYCGCAASLIGLILIALTAIVFERWRKEFTNKVYLNLSAAIGLLVIAFLFSAFLTSSPNSNTICLCLGAVLHYSVLSTFTWMLITAVLSYRKLVYVFNTNSTHRLLKACLCGWLIPLGPVLLLVIINHTSYIRATSIEQPTLFCFPSGLGFWLTVFLPILLIVIINTILFCLIIFNVFIKAGMQQRENSQQIQRSITVSFLLFFLFGLTWIFGLLSHYLVLSYLFCISATLQGFVLFMFFVLANSSTRNMWRRKLKMTFSSESKSKDTTNRYWVNKNDSTSIPSRSQSTPVSQIPTLEHQSADKPNNELLPMLRYDRRRLSELL